MRNQIFKFITILALGSIFVACSSSSDSNSEEGIKDITLNAGDSIVCTKVTAFTIIPTNDPDVVFSTDAQSGDTSITIDSASTGVALVKNCTVQ